MSRFFRRFKGGGNEPEESDGKNKKSEPPQTSKDKGRPGSKKGDDDKDQKSTKRRNSHGSVEEDMGTSESLNGLAEEGQEPPKVQFKEEAEVKTLTNSGALGGQVGTVPLVDVDGGRLESEDSEEDSGEETEAYLPAEGAYDPEEFAQLDASEDVKMLFQFITAYQPQIIELETCLKPFVPDFIPAVGDIDAFIKIPRPDEIEDNIGLTVLDEPCGLQSDPSVLSLQLRATMKGKIPDNMVVKQVERADKNPQELESWIKNISELHRSKPATNVHYTKPMPDIETLMQEWPSDFEELLKSVDLPGAESEMSLEQYVDTICAALDIPVYKSRIQALHVFFTLYSEFKNSQHFKSFAENGSAELMPVQEAVQDEALEQDRLVL